MDSVGATARTPRRSPVGAAPSEYDRIPDELRTRVYIADKHQHQHLHHQHQYHQRQQRVSGQQDDPTLDGSSSTHRHRLRSLKARDTSIGSLTPVHTYQRQRHQSIDSFLSKYVDVVESMTASKSSPGRHELHPSTKTERFIKIFIYGMLNTVIMIPVMISFAQIIFRDPVFQPYMSELIRLVLTSAAIHQMVFTASSSLNFAIGQVQDAGLIFLSAMASSTALLLQRKDPNIPMEALLASTLFTLAISTALLGMALVVTGKLKLASFVQYLPMPVVGGYLAYIGFYCLEAGLSMMSGKSIQVPQDWLLLWDLDALVLTIPGVVAGLVIFQIVARCNHVAVMPCCLMAILAMFYGWLLLSGQTLEQARQAGWIAQPPTTQKSIVDVYKYYNLELVDLSFVTGQVPTWIAMYFVVAFSSSLDVAAIEMALGASLDHNHELQTVGWSNLVCGLTGGFTGSYIFSQTIFTLKAQLDSRLIGILVALLEVGMVLCPWSVIAYLPKLFFGALQTWIACDLMMEWMWHARHKMLPSEYVIVWCTFLLMNVFNLEVGILLGITIAAFNFIYAYVTVSSVRRVMKASRVERDLHERALLQRVRLSIVALELDGFIFFGSSVKMMNEVRKHVLIPTTRSDHGALDPSNTITSTSNMVWSRRTPQQHQQHHSHQLLPPHASPNESTPLQSYHPHHQALSIQASDGDELCTLDEASAFIPIHSSTATTTTTTTTTSKSSNTKSGIPSTRSNNNSINEPADDSTDGLLRRDSMLHAVRTRFFIWDFTKVRGVDATAVRSCFHATKQLLAQHGIEMMFANVPPEVERLLRVHQVIEDPDVHHQVVGGGAGGGEDANAALAMNGGGSLVFDTLDRALEWCEDELLVAEGLLPASETALGPHHWDDWEDCPIQFLDDLLPTPGGSRDGNSRTKRHKQLDHQVDHGSPTLALQALTTTAVDNVKDNDNNDDDDLQDAMTTTAATAGELTRELADLYIQTLCRDQGEYIYRAGDPVEGVYFIGSGKIDVYLPSNVHECMGPGFVGPKRVLRVSKGAIVGAAEMTLHHQHQFTAEARAKTLLFFLSKRKYHAMQQQHPLLASRFQQAMVQTLARTVMEFNFNE